MTTSDPREALDRIKARDEEASRHSDRYSDLMALADSQADVPRLVEALEEVIRLSHTWDLIADRLYHDGDQTSVDQADVIRDDARDVRRAIEAALNEEEQG